MPFCPGFSQVSLRLARNGPRFSMELRNGLLGISDNGRTIFLEHASGTFALIMRADSG